MSVKEVGRALRANSRPRLAAFAASVCRACTAARRISIFNGWVLTEIEFAQGRKSGAKRSSFAALSRSHDRIVQPMRRRRDYMHRRESGLTLFLYYPEGKAYD